MFNFRLTCLFFSFSVLNCWWLEAPEILRLESYTHAVDWWSLGVLFYALLRGKVIANKNSTYFFFAICNPTCVVGSHLCPWHSWWNIVKNSFKRNEPTINHAGRFFFFSFFLFVYYIFQMSLFCQSEKIRWLLTARMIYFAKIRMT